MQLHPREGKRRKVDQNKNGKMILDNDSRNYFSLMISKASILKMDKTMKHYQRVNLSIS